MKKGKSIKLYRRGVLVIAMLMVSLMLITNISAASVCCEQTLAGAWCQNEEQSLCDTGFKIAPTSCESTSFCKKGCCYDSQEGLCMENTPQKVCEESGATWNENAECAIPQCNLGCCILGDQAALTTLTRCKSLSGYYEFKADFRSGIKDEASCIATANAQDKGACVFEDSETASLTCDFTTRGECDAPAGQIIEGENVSDSSKRFYADILCSAEELGTTCAPTRETMIIEGKDEIYYVDSCGNKANIYDSERYDDKAYWKNLLRKSESCGAGNSNANSKSCGNCDYFLGSIGKSAGRLNAPTYGDYICADLSCDGRDHGESWCLADEGAGDGKDKVGSRFYRAICLNNEKIIEPCADFRNEICVESGASFSEAACIVNRWQDCTEQVDQDDCENLDTRECKWVEDFYFSQQESQILPSKENNESPNGLCVPMHPPGFKFWGKSDAIGKEQDSKNPLVGNVIKSFKMIGHVITGKAEDEGETFSATDTLNTINQAGETEKPFSATEGRNPFGSGAVRTKSDSSSSSICSKGNAKIIIEYEKTFGSVIDVVGGNQDTDCKENCEFETEEGRNEWAQQMNDICASLGDCGGHVNWAGEKTDDGYAAYWEEQRFAGSGGAERLEDEGESSPTTGKVVVDFLKDIYGGEED